MSVQISKIAAAIFLASAIAITQLIDYYSWRSLIATFT